MTLKTCLPSDWWNDSALPTIATLRLEWQRAVQETLNSHRAVAVITCPPECWCWEAEAKLNAMDIETAGEPDEWACPPRICPECDCDILPDNYCMMGHWCGEPRKYPYQQWPPPCEACHDSGTACGLCGGGNYGDEVSND